jgi:glycerophosphoryl diester phosphodiesterase
VRRVNPFGIVAHRGVTAGMRENTLEAFRRASAVGVDAIEFDVRITRDRVAVVHHDYYLDGSVPRPVPMFSVDAADVQAPRLQEVLAEFAGRLVLEIELKGPELEAADIAAGLLSSYRSSWDAMEITSFEPALLQRVGVLCAGLATALLTPASEPWMGHDVVAHAALHRARGCGASSVHLSATQLTPDVVRSVRAGGVDVHAHLINDEAALRLARSLDVAWICTDEPERALAFRRSLA